MNIDTAFLIVLAVHFVPIHLYFTIEIYNLLLKSNIEIPIPPSSIFKERMFIQKRKVIFLFCRPRYINKPK